MPTTRSPKSITTKRTSGTRKRAPKPAAQAGTSFGARLIAGMEGLVLALEAGGMAAVEKKFTVHRVRKFSFAKPALGKADIVAIRATLGASQPVFAGLLGVSVATVRAWEQGVNTPSGIALRFLSEVRTNPGYWKLRLKEAAGA